MTTIAMIAADSWSITIGGGWIILMMVGMGLCFVFMLGFMSLMRGGPGWTMCSWWRQQPPRQDLATGTFAPRSELPLSAESEGSR